MTNTRTRHTFAIDLSSAFLFYSAATGIWGLLAFIARNRLGADETWVGIIGAAGYAGYLWNLVFGRVSARMSIKSSVLAGMLVCTALMLVSAYITNVTAYCLAAVAFVMTAGFYELQYNTLVPHLYTADERPRRLSARQFVVSAAAVGLSAWLGRMCAGAGGHRTAFLIAGAMMALGAIVFTRLSTADRQFPEPFHPLDIVRTVWHDRRFRKTALVLIMYGWLGAGIATLLVLLYKKLGFDEGQVGILVGLRTGGMLLGLFLITPRLKFSGGITNFRLCFYASMVASIVYLTAASHVLGQASMAALMFAEVTLGVSGAGFAVGAQTTGPSLAGSGNVSLYVNALMIVLGSRGIIAPLVVAAVAHAAGLGVSLWITVGVAIACASCVVKPDRVAEQSS